MTKNKSLLTPYQKWQVVWGVAWRFLGIILLCGGLMWTLELISPTTYCSLIEGPQKGEIVTLHLKSEYSEGDTVYIRRECEQSNKWKESPSVHDCNDFMSVVTKKW